MPPIVFTVAVEATGYPAAVVLRETSPLAPT